MNIQARVLQGHAKENIYLITDYDSYQWAAYQLRGQGMLMIDIIMEDMESGLITKEDALKGIKEVNETYKTWAKGYTSEYQKSPL